MKKVLTIIIIAIIIFSNNIILKAECNNDLVTSVKTSIFATSMVKNNEEYEPYFHIAFGPVYSFIYVKVTNSENSKILTFNKNNTENSIGYIDVLNFYKTIKYKINFYTNLAECKDYLIKSIEINTPNFNKYSTLDVCKENQDFNMCDEFYDVKDISKQEFLEKLNEFNENKNKTNIQKFYDFVKKYYLFFAIPTLLVGGIYTYKIVKIKKGRKK